MTSSLTMVQEQALYTNIRNHGDRQWSQNKSHSLVVCGWYDHADFKVAVYPESRVYPYAKLAVNRLWMTIFVMSSKTNILLIWLPLETTQKNATMLLQHYYYYIQIWQRLQQICQWILSKSCRKQHLLPPPSSTVYGHTATLINVHTLKSKFF